MRRKCFWQLVNNIMGCHWYEFDIAVIFGLPRYTGMKLVTVQLPNPILNVKNGLNCHIAIQPYDKFCGVVRFG